ncbi:peptide-methionine (S)-S-oxide reductase MsrA [Candidatus Thioglobus sp. NP1]|uniref:peptide-methionine (S)-S-oxide reductase MsrA n=1 Tax=Candidatus Thioglobus sp. NP1 TaxID=2508687 RepID=UPI000DEDE277|nr:peptide-methionine (S)-S-oxide reductase MsrA [Candidatus Thioglobus sp. NP1]AXE62358.1 peptide methionine sulfoxide reductase [Candidatus Thioglobus sp. NP1]
MILEIFFAAGCFWGVEKNFESFDGVIDVVSGYSGGNYENPTYQDVLNNRRNGQGETFLSILKNIGMSDEEKENSNTLINHTETVKVVYDSSKVSTETLIKNFWEIHDPTQMNRQGNDVGNNYRSAIYWTTDKQKEIAIKTGQEFQKLLSEKGYGQIVTEMSALEKFWPAEDYHQDYLRFNPNGYCPDHSTGVAFLTQNSIESPLDKITPLGGKEIIVIGPEIEGTCLFCIEFEKKVTSKYAGTIPLRSTPASALSGFEIETPTWATPTIFLIEDGKEVWAHQGIMSSEDFYKALGDFKLGIGSEAHNVAFNDGTDKRFCVQYKIFKDTPEGIFVDKLSGRPLFDTADRFDSKSGWLSFTRPVDNEVYELIDKSYGMVRTEIRSVSSDIHLGHVFNDGPDGMPRYCINATVLEFVPRDDV